MLSGSISVSVEEIECKLNSHNSHTMNHLSATEMPTFFQSIKQTLKTDPLLSFTNAHFNALTLVANE